MVRIALGGLMHESNTFATSRTDAAAFESGGLETGQGIVDRWGAAHHEMGGFLEGAATFGFEAVPTLMGWATPAGPLTADAYNELLDRLIRAIRSAGPVDAVLLALHGAMVADGQADADGHTVATVRSLIGPDRPLIVSLDYHANVSPLVAQASDVLVAYRTYPHIDQRARGLKAAQLAFEAAEGRIRPTTRRPSRPRRPRTWPTGSGRFGASLQPLHPRRRRPWLSPSRRARRRSSWLTWATTSAAARRPIAPC
jgi:microcystin degradation protein MlrC